MSKNNPPKKRQRGTAKVFKWGIVIAGAVFVILLAISILGVFAERA